MIRHDEDACRYEAVDSQGQVMGWLGYRDDDIPGGSGHIVIYTTHTAPEHRGRGVAGLLTRRCLDDCIAAQRTVDTACWYAAEFVQRHPQYQLHVAAADF